MQCVRCFISTCNVRHGNRSKMFKVLILCGIFAFIIYGRGDKMVEKGKWLVLHIQKCKNDEQYDIKLDIIRKKITRSDDCFDANLTLPTEIDSTFGFHADICKFVDGGCKDYQVLRDESFEGFVRKYAENNFLDVLKLTGMDPPDFPLSPGEYNAECYLFNYCELPEDGIRGKYTATVYLIKDAAKVACVEVTIEFEEDEDEICVKKD